MTKKPMKTSSIAPFTAAEIEERRIAEETMARGAAEGAARATARDFPGIKGADAGALCSFLREHPAAPVEAVYITAQRAGLAPADQPWAAAPLTLRTAYQVFAAALAAADAEFTAAREADIQARALEAARAQPVPTARNLDEVKRPVEAVPPVVVSITQGTRRDDTAYRTDRPADFGHPRHGGLPTIAELEAARAAAAAEKIVWASGMPGVLVDVTPPTRAAGGEALPEPERVRPEAPLRSEAQGLHEVAVATEDGAAGTVILSQTGPTHANRAAPSPAADGDAAPGPAEPAADLPAAPDEEAGDHEPPPAA